MRGNLNGDQKRIENWRSIPAHAGQPFFTELIASAFSVYPRACGATVREDYQKQQANGLSPRMRGNPGIFTPDRYYTRSIPAHAGQPDASRL